MPRIPEDEIEKVKASVDLAALVRSRGVELKKHGSRDLIGRCPFHEEASASFVVTPAKRIFHCLGCGAAGNVIQFVERFDGVSFRHAFELLDGGAGFATPGEKRRKILTLLASVLVLGGLIAAGVWLVHTRIVPLDLLVEKLRARLPLWMAM